MTIPLNSISPLSQSFSSKLPAVDTNIFTVMSRMAVEQGAINISQGFPDFSCSDELINLVTQAMKAGHNQYAPMEGVMVLRERIAEKTEKLYGYAPDPVQEITITAGASEALFSAIQAFVRQGDEVIVFEPCYDSYIPAIELSGGKAVRVPLTTESYSIPWDVLKESITAKTKAIMINTPHNPTGTILNKEDMQQLAGVLRNTDILLISDEVYEHIIFDDQLHFSVLRHPELRERSLVMSSFGKTYHTTGWKTGYCIAPAPLTRELRKVHQFITFCNYTPVQYALAEYMKEPSHYMILPRFFGEKRDKFRSLMQQTRFRLLPCQGSYFQVASYAHITDEPDADFAVRLVKEFGVATIPVSAFYKEKTDHKVLRFCFAKKDETLERAVERLARV